MIPSIAILSPALAVLSDGEVDRDPSDWQRLSDLLEASSGDWFGSESEVPRKTPRQIEESIAEEVLRLDTGVIPDHLLLAVLLSGAVRGNPVDVALALLHSANGRIERISEPTLLEQQSVRPIGAARLLAAVEFSRRAMSRAAAMKIGPVDTARKSVEFLRTMSLGDLESLSAIYLDRRLRVIGMRTLSIGSSGFTVVDPREVFRPALEMRATAVIMAHNHPSGDPQPSLQDRDVTKRVAQAGRILDIKLLDHIVLGSGDSYVSFAEIGELPHF